MPRSRHVVVVALVLIGCGRSAKPHDIDYAAARRAFHTKLVHVGPSPQQWQPVEVAADAQEVTYTSGALALRAWISKPAGLNRPAVLFVHGGSAFGADDWEMTRPFRDAGFVVMMPILRGENGSPGAFSLFYDEVDDVLAAGEALAKQPGVDASHVYISGHSNGGTLTMLAAMSSTRFRAAAPLSGLVDATGIAGPPEQVPFDQTDPNEGRMRSVIAFAGSFKCPVRIYLGEQEPGLESYQELVRLARAAGRDIDLVRVPGNHHTMTTAAIPLAIALFQQQR